MQALGPDNADAADVRSTCCDFFDSFLSYVALTHCLRNIGALFHSVLVRSANPILTRILRFMRLWPSRCDPFTSFAGIFAGGRSTAIRINRAF